MEQKITKQIVRVGNSAGVLLPREWLNGTARVELIKKQINIKADIFDILEKYLDRVEGIYLVGSYARGEETKESDIDILVVTEGINKRIEKNRYNIILISRAELEKQIENNAIPIIPMLKEAKSIINPHLLIEYKSAKLTKKNLKFHIQTTKSALEIIKKFIDLKDENVSDNIMYSLILRLRETYIIECLQNNEIHTKHKFFELIKKISGSEEAYYAYKRAKEKPSKLAKVKLESARKIYEYVYNKIREQEK